LPACAGFIVHCSQICARCDSCLQREKCAASCWKVVRGQAASRYVLSYSRRRICTTSIFSPAFEADRAACVLQVPLNSAHIQLHPRFASHSQLRRSYRCIVAGTRFECPFDPPLVCGILDHWIAELQPHSNKRDPVLSRHYSRNGRLPWQRSLAELLSAKSLPQSLEHFCDLEHVHDSVMFNTQRNSFKDTCDRMLAKLKRVGESSDRQQELAAWMAEGLKDFAPHHKFAHVGSCASCLDTSDSDLNMLMQPHDPQASPQSAFFLCTFLQPLL